MINEDVLVDVMEGFKAQTVRLEQQVDLFARHIKAAEKDGAPAQLYRSVTDLLLDTSWRTVHALCMSPKRVPELETVVQPLFHVFRLAGREMDLVHWAIDKDIGEGVKEAALLFRVPSTATRLLRCVFFNSEGAEYLRTILTSPLRKLTKQKMDIELDPNRLPFDLDAPTKAELLKGSAKLIVSVADSVLQTAFKSIESVPIMIRKVRHRAAAWDGRAVRVGGLVCLTLVLCVCVYASCAVFAVRAQYVYERPSKGRHGRGRGHEARCGQSVFPALCHSGTGGATRVWRDGCGAAAGAAARAGAGGEGAAEHGERCGVRRLEGALHGPLQRVCGAESGQHAEVVQHAD